MLVLTLGPCRVFDEPPLELVDLVLRGKAGYGQSTLLEKSKEKQREGHKNARSSNY